MGIGYTVLQKIFERYTDTHTWRLDTIKEENGNCHLYEKCGFVRVGEEHVINAYMTLVDYERNTKGGEFK
jgi:L-amino acid N-acyltransferase YncA